MARSIKAILSAPTTFGVATMHPNYSTCQDKKFRNLILSRETSAHLAPTLSHTPEYYGFAGPCNLS